MKVLLLDEWTDEAKAELAKVCEVFVPDEGFCPAAHDGLSRMVAQGNWDVFIHPQLGEFDGLIPALNGFMPNLADMANLRFIATCTTGLDHIDTDYCQSHNVAVLSLQGAPFLREVYATAEHTVALMLALLRRIPAAHRDVCEGRWDRERWRGIELRGKRVAVIGCGRVGGQVAAMLSRAFAMRLATVRKDGEQTRWWLEGVSRGAGNTDEALANTLPHCDIVTVHVPLNDSTRGMFAEAQFRAMKPTAYLINTSRGAVVDEDALLRALREGWIAGAALDVLRGEPYVNSDLVDWARTHDNLVLTPHIAGNTQESRLKTQLRMVEKIREFVGGVRHDACAPTSQAGKGGIR